MASMFKRSGGTETVRRIIKQYHAALVREPLFEPIFRDRDMARLADRHRRFLTWVMDGPASFDGEAERRTRADLRLTPKAFDLAMQHLRAVLDANLASQADVDHVMRAVFRREPLIVDPGDDEDPV